VQLIFDLPVAADDVGELLGAGFAQGQ